MAKQATARRVNEGDIGSGKQPPAGGVRPKRAGRPKPAEAAYLIVETRVGLAWREHVCLPADQTKRAIQEAELARKLAGVAEVCLSIEFVSAGGRLARRELFRAPGLVPELKERSPLSGFNRDEWDLFLGNWIDQVDGSDPEDDADLNAALERLDDRKTDVRAQRVLSSKRRESKGKGLLLAAPVAAFVIWLGLSTDLFAIDFTAKAAVAPATPAVSTLAVKGEPLVVRR
ncbi:MAG: hypothetical protein EXQ86_08745 [Rhodospirillales bacterium]|nr:hypothetical protein [Rhodospirillales bacterium]